MKKLLSLLLVFIMLFSACKQSDSNSNSTETNLLTANTPVNVYRTQFYKLPAEFHPNLENTYRQHTVHYRDGLIYILGRDYEWKSVMLVYNPEREMGRVEPLTPYNDGAGIDFLEYCSDDSVVTVEALENGVTLNKMSADGEKLFSLDLSEVYEYNNNTRTYKLLIGKDDTIYIVNDYFVAVVSADGKVLYNVSLNEYEYWNMDMFDNGDIFVVMHDFNNNRTIYKYIDADRKALGDDVELTTGFTQYSETVLHGGVGYDMYYQTPDTLSGYNKATKEMTPLMNWINANLNTRELRSVEIISPELIITTSQSNIDDSYSLGISTPSDWEFVDNESDTGVKTINLAILTSNTYMILPAVTEFNKTNSKYQINVETYLIDEYKSDYTRLNADIASGKIPDLIFANDFPMRNYLNKGMIANIYDFIDNDPDLSRSDFIESVLVSGEAGDKLCQLPIQFSLNTLYGKQSNIGNIDGWTYTEFKEKWDAVPDGVMMGDEISKWTLLYYFTLSDMYNFVDYENGTCNFDNPEFIEAMRIISSFSDEAPRYEVKSEDYLDYYYGLYSSYKDNTIYLGDNNTMSVQYIITGFRRFDYEPMSFPGFPTVSGKNGAYLYTYNTIITEQSKVKDGAWEFVKYMLKDELQANYSLNMHFAVTKSALKQQFYYLYNEFTDNADYYYIDERTGFFNNATSRLTPEDRLRNGYAEFVIPEDLFDTILEILDNVNSTSIQDTTLTGIINEEIRTFWDGRGTLEETAKIIQNRVSVYMSEIK
jgi:ABC-type sugar transport system, periplasmic component